MPTQIDSLYIPYHPPLPPFWLLHKLWWSGPPFPLLATLQLNEGSINYEFITRGLWDTNTRNNDVHVMWDCWLASTALWIHSLYLRERERERVNTWALAYGTNSTLLEGRGESRGGVERMQFSSWLGDYYLEVYRYEFVHSCYYYYWVSIREPSMIGGFEWLKLGRWRGHICDGEYFEKPT